MASIFDWSKTAGDNDTADSGINFQENQYPSTVNNSARQVMGRVAEFRDDISGALLSTNISNAFSITTNSAFTTQTDGRVLSFRASASNTGAATLNVNSIGAKAIRYNGESGDAALTENMIRSGCIYVVRYVSAANGGSGAWILQTPSMPASAFVQPIPVGSIHQFLIEPSSLGKGAVGTGHDYLELDGSTWNNSDFPDLAAHLGQGGSTFTLPNTKDTGRFLRSRTASLAAGTAQTNQTAAHTHAVSATTSTESVGHSHTFSGTTAAMNANATHSHGISGGNTVGQSSTIGAGGAAFTAVITPATLSINSANIDHAHTFSGTTTDRSAAHTHSFSVTSGSAGAGTETRPEALAVIFCIKT